jgi:hypothetical protein
MYSSAKSKFLDDAIHALRNNVAEYTKRYQTSGDSEEPVQILNVLTGYYTTGGVSGCDHIS